MVDGGHTASHARVPRRAPGNQTSSTSGWGHASVVIQTAVPLSTKLSDGASDLDVRWGGPTRLTSYGWLDPGRPIEVQVGTCGLM
jgi:hypothetical protein